MSADRKFLIFILSLDAVAWGAVLAVSLSAGAPGLVAFSIANVAVAIVNVVGMVVTTATGWPKFH